MGRRRLYYAPLKKMQRLNIILKLAINKGLSTSWARWIQIAWQIHNLLQL
jgi:hypothetical protein